MTIYETCPTLESERFILRLYIGRIFIDSVYHIKGYGIRLKECIEKYFPCAAEFNLDTPCWNERTNAFYKRLGYSIIKVEDGFVFYRKKKKSEQTQRQILFPNGRRKHERNTETDTDKSRFMRETVLTEES